MATGFFKIRTGINVGGAASDPSGAAGDLAYRTDTNLLKYYNGSWRTVVNLDEAQTLTSKTLTSPTISGGALSGTFTGAHTYSGVVTLSAGLAGTATNDSATAGNVGEYVSSTQTSYITTNTPATTQYGDITSISLTAGDWDVTGSMSWFLNSATANTYIKLGISTTSGNSSSGLGEGHNLTNIRPMTGVSNDNSSGVICSYRISLSATTTIYLKANLNYLTATPSYTFRLSARRRR